MDKSETKKPTKPESDVEGLDFSDEGFGDLEEDREQENEDDGQMIVSHLQEEWLNSEQI